MMGAEEQAALEEFRRTCREFAARDAAPYQEQWDAQGLVDRAFWTKAGDAGLLGMGVDTQLGGGGTKDYRFVEVLIQALIQAGVSVPGIVCHNDVVASYFDAHGTAEQRKRWLPDLCKGKRVAAIAVTEPGGGSDPQAIRTVAERRGDAYVLNGSKAYITNGLHGDLVVVAVQTGKGHGPGVISLIVVERDSPGFSRGPALKKLGWHSSDTTLLHFDDCRVPESNLLGKEGLGSLYFLQAMARERVSISCVAVASAELALSETIQYAKSRQAFGSAIGALQHNRFLLAKLDSEVRIARVFLQDCVAKFNAGKLDAAQAARLKWWTTELQVRVADRCMQLWGGAGYMSDSRVGQLWANSRVQTIYGGTSEIMLEFIGRSLGL